MQQALADGTHLLLEATSNQVNQDGGYTGMTPAAFREFAFGLAAKAGLSRDRITLGGDHLGPNPWQNQPARVAMERAAEMMRHYAVAGFTKIHLDASMRCADDPAVLPDETVAQRSAELCRVAELAADGATCPMYVIGTEVPVPGGAAHALTSVDVTRPEAVERTLEIHRRAFHAAGLDAVWERVAALVVQPGVEFDHDSVIEYDPQKAASLQEVLKAHPEIVFEAHSTDYQQPKVYRELVQDGFAVLKVGPALTFALREALYALAAIERELVSHEACSGLVETMEKAMMADPGHWTNYYHGDEHAQRRLRVYSYSDRIRYYWNKPEVETSVERLIANLRRSEIPETVLSQHLPEQYESVRAGDLENYPKALALAKIRSVLKSYAAACC